MPSLLIKSLGRHLRWWLASFWKINREISPLSFQRLCFLLFGFPIFALVQTIHGVCLLLDELLFPSFKETQIKSPVFVLGIPRSGTTFLHRYLAKQSTDYTTFSMWEALLAPSIIQRKIFQNLGKIDRSIGSPFKHLFDRILKAASGDFNDIHSVGLDVAEEDYLALLPFGNCFIMLLAFPFADHLASLGKLDEMPEGERDSIIDGYQSMLRRHLYCNKGKTLLSKNAAFASWGSTLAEAFPSAKFFACTREPASALSSQISSLTAARVAFASDPSGEKTKALFTELYTHFYQSLEAFIDTSPSSTTAVIAQHDLRTKPNTLISKACTQLGLTKPEEKPESTTKKEGSKHQHSPDDFSLDRQIIARSMTPKYESMLRSPNRVKLDQE